MPSVTDNSASARLPADDNGGYRGAIIDLAIPWPHGETPWQRAMRETAERSERLAEYAEQQLSQPDSTSVLRGIGLAILSLRAELAAEDARRES